jgi:peptide/nickel transport system permease protein
MRAVRGAARFYRSLPRTGQAGVIVIVAILLAGLVIPQLSPYGAFARVGTANTGPTLAHPFGIDNLGRDIFTRSFAATHLDMLVAVVGVLIPLLIGTIVGALAATTDVRAIRGVVGLLVDGINAFPFLILALGLIAVLGTGPVSLVLAIALTSWARYAKLARTRASVLRDLDFVSALKLLGYGRARVIVRHILPNCFSETAAYAVSDFTLIILTVAALSFLGAGVRPPTPEWGSMMADGRIYLQSAPWLLVGPGIVLTITAFGVSLIGEALKGQQNV